MTLGLMTWTLPRAIARATGEVERDESTQRTRLAAGDLAALGEAYDEHHAAVRAFARRLVGDDEAAEDLVQETFVALPDAARSYRGDAPIRTFVLGVAFNHARHHVRAAARRRATVQRFASEPERRSPDPEGEAARRELAAALTRALDELPVDQRGAFVLCELEERSSAEVAQIMGVPEGTVRTRAFHARRKLRALLEAEGLP
jgi:RNA polymerase sigma-70 factor (ECF subfamily)